MNVDCKIGTKALFYAVLWIMIISIVAFPQILEKGKSFFMEQCGYENIGKFYILAFVTYTFDLMLQILYSTDKNIHKTLFVTTSVYIAFCLLFMVVAIAIKLQNMWLFLPISMFMVIMKGTNLYMIDIVSINKAKALRLQQKDGTIDLKEILITDK
jgi:hypothetical protein